MMAMSDKVYQCPRCGHVCLGEGDAPVCTECFLSNVTREPALMVQVCPAPGWISVEGMPDDVGKCVVLVAFPDGYADSFLAKRHEGEWWVASSAAFWHGVPTHYMPVPTAPEERER